MMIRGAAIEFLVIVVITVVQLCTQACGFFTAVGSTAKLFSSTCPVRRSLDFAKPWTIINSSDEFAVHILWIA